MIERSLHRRVAAPVSLFAALALAAGGGSTPWATGRSGSANAPAAAPAGPATVHLEHLELVAMRAQSVPAQGAR